MTIMPIRNASVFNKETGRQEEVEIHREEGTKTECCTTIYFRVQTLAQKVIGELKLHVYSDSLWVERMDNHAQRTYSKVGTALLNSVVLEALVRKIDKVALDACYSSHAFYFTYGLKPKDDSVSKYGAVPQELTEKHKKRFTKYKEMLAIENGADENDEAAITEAVAKISDDELRQNWSKVVGARMPNVISERIKEAILGAGKGRADTTSLGSICMIFPKELLETVAVSLTSP